MLSSYEWRGGTREEYETQHFGFGAQRLGIALRGVIEEKIISNVRDMESSLLSSLVLSDEERGELRRSSDKLIGLYCHRADPVVTRIQEELNKLLEIPETAVLPEDEEKAKQVTDQEYEALRAEVAALEKNIQRNALMESLLTKEEEELKSVERHCELARQAMEHLQTFQNKLMSKGEVLKKLTRDTEEVCEGLPAVKNMEDFL